MLNPVYCRVLHIHDSADILFNHDLDIVKLTHLSVLPTEMTPKPSPGVDAYHAPTALDAR